MPHCWQISTDLVIFINKGLSDERGTRMSSGLMIEEFLWRATRLEAGASVFSLGSKNHVLDSGARLLCTFNSGTLFCWKSTGGTVTSPSPPPPHSSLPPTLSQSRTGNSINKNLFGFLQCCGYKEVTKQLPGTPLRFQCVGGCWDWTQDCCFVLLGSQNCLTTVLDLFHSSARSHSQLA